MKDISTKPYLLRALFEWCNDSGLTPYVTVAVGAGVRVPPEYVKDGEIVLNVSPLATSHLTIGNETLEFQARFGGVAREVSVPMRNVRAIYARETGQGMAFDGAPVLESGEPGQDTEAPPPLHAVPPSEAAAPPSGTAPLPGGDRPRLTRIK